MCRLARASGGCCSIRSRIPAKLLDVAAAHADVVERLSGDSRAWMLQDTEMTEHGSYLVPRDARGGSGSLADPGLMRLDDASQRQPPAQAAP